MSRLPFFTVVMLAIGILAWNFSFYRGYYQAQAGGTIRGHVLPVQPGDPSLRGGPGAMRAAQGAAQAPDLQRAETLDAFGERGELDAELGGEGARGSSQPGGDGSRGPTATGASATGVLESEYYPGGKRRSEGRLVEGRREGIWAEWYESGEPLSRGRYEEGLRDGRWLYWYDSGKPQHEGDYDAGRREGTWRSWHENGKHMHEGRYYDGDREGMWRQWYSNGQVMEAGRYVKGLREGWWEFYDFAGRSDKRAGWYEAGRRIR